MSDLERPKAGILVVDGDASTAKKVREHFVKLGTATDIAQNAEDALGMLEEKKYDIAVIEVVLSGMDGIELLRTIRKHFPMVHCIMFGSGVTLGILLSCIRHGADTCVFKPMESLDELERAVKKAQDNIADWWGKIETLIRKRR